MKWLVMLNRLHPRENILRNTPSVTKYTSVANMFSVVLRKERSTHIVQKMPCGSYCSLIKHIVMVNPVFLLIYLHFQ